MPFEIYTYVSSPTFAGGGCLISDCLLPLEISSLGVRLLQAGGS